MYDASLSYDENYLKGPFSFLTPEKKFPKIKYTQKPTFEFLGIPLHIPFGVAAGPLLNSKFVRVAFDAGFCLPTYKTVRSTFWKCNNWPNVLSIHSKNQSLSAENSNKVISTHLSMEDYFKKNISISNSFGVPSKSPEIWMPDFHSLLPYSKQLGVHAVLSFQVTRQEALTLDKRSDISELFYQDAQKVCELAIDATTQAGFCLLEVNLSCPNEKHFPIYKDLSSAIKLLSCLHEVLKQDKRVKLIAKIGSMTNDDIHIFLSEAAEYLNAISAINTISADIFTAEGKIALGSQSLSGGVCGRLIFEEGVRMASRIVHEREKLGINKQDLGLIGVGGVMTADDFKTYMSAGVDLVQSATGMMWNLNLAQEIAMDLNIPFILEN